jgi:signal transduction histidine kinase
MNRLATLSLRLLHLTVRKRLVLVLGALVVSLGLYGLAFPATTLGGILVLPIILCAWLFGWRGGLLCIAGVTLLLGAWYGMAFGETFWSSAWFVPFVLGTLSGLAVCVTVGLLRRITDALLSARQTAEHAEHAYEQANTLNVLRDQALQNLHHELLTPLTQIMGYLELLETYRDTYDADAQAHFLASARCGCEELLSLTETALATEQGPVAQHPLYLRAFSLRHEVQRVLAHFDPSFLQERQVELEIAEAVQVHADPGFVRQVVRNLLTNSCKYAPTRTPLRVSAACMSATDHPHGRAGMICVQVSDQGPGIPLELQSQLFQRFVRLPDATASTQPGSGLGLAICKQLVEAMGGSIWVESTGRTGEGCCFAFTLPGDNAPVDAGDHEQCERERYDKAKAPREEQREGGAPCLPRRGG